MAYLNESRPVVINWQNMRNFWIYSAGQISNEKAASVKAYLNKFVANNPGYSFTITQLYDELYQVCITTDQCLSIKRELNKRFRIDLPDARPYEPFPGGTSRKKSFKNSADFRQLREHGLAALNKPIIRRKHQEAQNHFTKVNKAFQTQDEKYFLAFDIEVYEHDHSEILEIGYVIVRFSPAPRHAQGNLPNLEVTSRQHLIIEENLSYKNGDRVPDNRYGFQFGQSKTLPMADAVEKFRRDMRECNYIVGHSAQNDEDYLKELGVDLSALRTEVFDTQVVQIYKESIVNSEKYFMCSLSHLLKEYKLNYQDSHLHNAGCDAFYTMMLFLRQMGYGMEQVNGIIESEKN